MIDTKTRVFIETLVAGRATHNEVAAGDGALQDQVDVLDSSIAALALAPSGVPLHIASGSTFTINDNTQVLFALPITVDGSIRVEGTGVLVGVD